MAGGAEAVARPGSGGAASCLQCGHPFHFQVTSCDVPALFELAAACLSGEANELSYSYNLIALLTLTNGQVLPRADATLIALIAPN